MGALVTWLVPLRRSDGITRPARTVYEVLRQDGNFVNLCEQKRSQESVAIIPRPLADKIGETFCRVPIANSR